MRLTIICPEAFIDSANHYAMCLGNSEAERYTYGQPTWVDATGGRYSVASLEVTEEFLTVAVDPLTRPSWDNGEVVDLAQAAKAQALVVVSNSFDKAKITAVVDESPALALASFGLERVNAT